MNLPPRPVTHRSRRVTGLLACALSALLAACATEGPRPQSGGDATVTRIPVEVPTVAPTPAEDALRQLVAYQERLDRVAAPLLVNNPQLCKGHARHLLGFTAKTRYSYSADYVDAAQKLFKLDERLTVTGVLPGSGAARVGVARGDGLVAVEDKPLPQGPNAERQAAAILAPLVNKRSSLKLTVLRDGSNLDLNVPLTLACAFRVELGNVDAVNAYSDGHRVLVTRGMMSFARTDAELAYVLAREFAHNALGHPARLHASATIAGVIDNMIRVKPDLSMTHGTAGIKPYAQEIDAAADTTGLYMAARAGYAIDGAAAFWQRLATQTPASVMNGYTAIHPATAYRLSAIETAETEIKARQAARKPLMP